MRSPSLSLVFVAALFAGCAGSPDGAKDTDVDTTPGADTDVPGDTDITTDTDVADDTDVAADTDIAGDTDVVVDTDSGVLGDTDSGVLADTDSGVLGDTDSGVLVDTDVADTDLPAGAVFGSGTFYSYGGTLTLSNGAEVILPEYAVGDGTTISATFYDSANGHGWADVPMDGLDAVGEAVVLKPHGTPFFQAVTVRIPTTLSGDEVVLLRLSDEADTTWEPDGAVTVSGGFAEFQVWGFSVYALAQATAGNCPCWSGANLKSWDTAHLVRADAVTPRYGTRAVGTARESSVAFQTSTATDALTVQVDPTTGGACTRNGDGGTAVFGYTTRPVSASQGRTCELLLGAKFRAKVDGSQIGVVASGLAANEAVGVQVDVNQPGVGLVSDDVLAVGDGLPAWITGVFLDGAQWSATVVSNPAGLGCSAVVDYGATVSPDNTIVEVTCGVDTDGDGVPDLLDVCPNDPTKTDWEGYCGCDLPDSDADGDHTPDCVDGCPNDYFKASAGVCGCSISDVDVDLDSVPDCLDGCPDDIYKTAAGACGCGNSEQDSDLDSAPDCIDGCPTDPNKDAPRYCGCGVADTDVDLDGIIDCQDLVPTFGPTQPSADRVFGVDLFNVGNAVDDLALVTYGTNLFSAELGVTVIDASGVAITNRLNVAAAAPGFRAAMSPDVAGRVHLLYTESSAAVSGYSGFLSVVDTSGVSPVTTRDHIALDGGQVPFGFLPAMDVASLRGGLDAVVVGAVNAVEVTLVDTVPQTPSVVTRRVIFTGTTERVTRVAVASLSTGATDKIGVVYTVYEQTGLCGAPVYYNCQYVFRTYLDILVPASGLASAVAVPVLVDGATFADTGDVGAPVAITQDAAGKVVVGYGTGGFELLARSFTTAGAPTGDVAVLQNTAAASLLELSPLADGRLVFGYSDPSGAGRLGVLDAQLGLTVEPQPQVQEISGAPGGIGIADLPHLGGFAVAGAAGQSVQTWSVYGLR
jgi:hypothetical protein